MKAQQPIINIGTRIDYGLGMVEVVKISAKGKAVKVEVVGDSRVNQPLHEIDGHLLSKLITAQESKDAQQESDSDNS
jgi:hypothetical protein